MLTVNGTPISVVVADKSPLVRAGLQGLLNEDERFELLGVAENGEQFLTFVEQQPFQVGIVGWVMPGMGGSGVLENLRDRPDAPRVVIYTGDPSSDIPRQAMRLGGAGFCSKSEPPSQLLDSVARVATGQMIFPFVDVRELHSYPMSELTPRERELLAALSEGRSNAQLAARFDISIQTVKFHLKNVYEKLGIGNRAQAVALYVSEKD
ncbi:MAG: response regulator transcription factor [Deltaproteobacteria bacterium]|nr:response regulator transcription factor [Deltaproteobacteria bacterium]MBW2577031.1 response regulator transcription factor [Deltaproteobacteria bacterium]MBW2691451.1 response regulator transcription factor [Deltaproteobacteria bacterium]